MLNKLGANITATDHHPEVHSFLKRNTKLNNGSAINFERTDWSDENDKLGHFDLIIGSDLLYEDEHIELLAKFVGRHAKPTCEIIIVDPGRGRKNKLTSLMSEYGYLHEHTKPDQTNYLQDPFKGYILKFWRNSSVFTS